MLMLKRSAILAAALIAVTAWTTTPATAASVVTKGTGWKHTSQLGVYAASPSQTYWITFDTAGMKARYAPYYKAALTQINAAGLHLKVGGVEPVDINKCGPAYHVQVTERYRPLGTAGWSKGVPCPNQPKGLGRGGIAIYDSEYWTGWPIADHVLRNTIVHEILHTLGLDHPNYDKDKDGTVEPHECVATSYGNKPLMCSPNGGYSTAANKGKLVGYDINGVKQLIANAKAQGLK